MRLPLAVLMPFGPALGGRFSFRLSLRGIGGGCPRGMGGCERGRGVTAEGCRAQSAWLLVPLSAVLFTKPYLH
jgi:hypothetical protein